MTKTVTTGKATDLITFTRSTTGTYLDSVKYGDELVTNGDFSNGGANWSVNNTDATHYVVFENNSARFVADTSTPIVELLSDAVLEANETYKVEVNISSITSGSIKIDGAGVSQLYNSVGTTVSFIRPSGGNNVIKFYRAQAGVDLVINSVSVKKVIGNQGTSGEPLLRTANTNEPRIEYDADGNLKGLLIEEQRTNLASDSEDMIVPFSRLTSESTTSPTGETTAQSWKIADQQSGYWYKYGAINSGTIYTASVFVKLPTEANNAGLRYVRLGSQTTFSTDNAVFDLQTGEQTSATMNSGFVGSSITPCGNGWYRISITDTATSTTSGGSFSFVLFPASDSSGGSWTQTSDMVGKYLLHTFGWQTETGSFPTSYIPTSGSTVTRNADVATINVSEFEYNTTEGSISMEIVPPSNNSGEQQWILGSNTNSARWAYTNAGFDRAIAYDGVNTFNGEDLQPSTINKIATGTDQSTAAIYVNGESIQGSQTTNGNIASLTTIFYLGGNFSTGNVNLGGHIKSVKYYPVRLTDNQLKALTQ
jgi:hypothetical protein